VQLVKDLQAVHVLGHLEQVKGVSLLLKYAGAHELHTVPMYPTLHLVHEELLTQLIHSEGHAV